MFSVACTVTMLSQCNSLTANGYHHRYLDGISYDRLTMRRVRKVLDAARPGGVGLLDFHGGNLFDIPQTDCCHPGCDALGAVCKGPWSGATSSALAYMDLFPYL